MGLKTTVTKSFYFDYAHFLPHHDGKCANMHGHRGEMQITFDRCPKEKQKSGMVIDFYDVKKIIEPIVEQLDHAYLNNIIDNPTAENLLLWVYHQIQNTELKFCVKKIRIYETPDNFAELTV